MSKFNKYAKELKAVFETHRAQYTDALKKLEQARKHYLDNKDGITGRSMAEIEAKKAALIANKEEAEATFNAYMEEYNESLRADISEVTKAFEKAIAEEKQARPEDMDNNTMELLKSGMLKYADYKGLYDMHEGNFTMQRLIAQYAKEQAKTAGADERQALNALSVECKSAFENKLYQFKRIKEVAMLAGGVYHGRAGEKTIKNMHYWDDEGVQAAIEEF